MFFSAFCIFSFCTYEIVSFLDLNLLYIINSLTNICVQSCLRKCWNVLECLFLFFVPDSCIIESRMRDVIKHCREAYSWTDDDTKLYLPGWVTPTPQQEQELKGTEGPFVYQNSVKMKNTPYVGTLATYKGGGYALLTRRDLCRTRQVFFYCHIKRH